ncbi:hypothetical protein COBT_003290 [Conglomerata obtusa]
MNIGDIWVKDLVFNKLKLVRRFICGEESDIATYCPHKVIKDNTDSYLYVSCNNINNLTKKFSNITKDYLFNKYNDILSRQNEKIKFCNLKKCIIKTIGSKIVRLKPNAIPLANEERAIKYSNGLLNIGIIRNSVSIWRNPVRFLEKPNEDLRLVLDSIQLNNLVIKEDMD